MIKGLLSKNELLFSTLLTAIIVFHYWWSLGCNLLIMLTLVLVILLRDTRQKLFATFRNKWFWVLSTPLWLSLYGLLFSEDSQLGYQIFEKRLSIGVFPLLFLTLRRFINKQSLLDAIVLGGFSSLAFCFGQSLWIYLSGEAGTEIFYSDLLAYPLYGQAVYVAFMINVWLLIIFYQVINKIGLIGQSKLISSSLFILLIIAHFLLASRMSTLVLLGVSFVFFAGWGAKKLGVLKSFLLVGVLLVVGVIMTQVFPKSLNRYRNIDKFSFDYENKSPLNHFNGEYNENNWTGITVRLAIWNSILEDLDQLPFYGAGTGDVESTLLNGFQKRKFHLGLQQNFNTHNQYLDFLLSTGYMGLVLFIGSLLFLIVYAIKTKNYVFLIFLLITMMTMMTENILNRNMGILFFGFVNALLFTKPVNQTD